MQNDVGIRQQHTSAFSKFYFYQTNDSLAQYVLLQTIQGSNSPVRMNIKKARAYYCAHSILLKHLYYFMICRDGRVADCIVGHLDVGCWFLSFSLLRRSIAPDRNP